ncbi:MAG: family 16 glycoside hydrolase [Opitutaceae bacterium]
MSKLGVPSNPRRPRRRPQSIPTNCSRPTTDFRERDRCGATNGFKISGASAARPGRKPSSSDYLIAGPFKNLKHYKPQDWNEIVVTVRGGVAHCTCNGEVLDAAMAVPATGPIGIEGDRGQMEYRRIRIKPLE